MSIRSRNALLATLALLFAASSAQAAGTHKPRSAPRVKPKEPTYRTLAAEHLKELRSRGVIFHRIAVEKNYQNAHVVFRDADVTAFLDLTDPQHPSHDPTLIHDGDLDGLDARHFAHVLVVPNAPREHIAKDVGGPIGTADLKAALKVTEAAEALAQRLGIQKARVFINPQNRLAIGYLHVHIIGERDPALPYPKAP